MSCGAHRGALLVLIAATTSGCGFIVGPICRARQYRAPVATLTGEVAPGATLVHRVKYGKEGSQNDLLVSWSGQREPGGPRLKVYLTRIECEAFDPTGDPKPRGDVCANIGSIGSVIAPEARDCVRSNACHPLSSDLVQVGAGVSHGRGNPETLGPTAEFKVWVVGDLHQPAAYRIDITSFFGPDC